MLKSVGLAVGVLHYINLVAGVDVANLDKEAGSLQYVHLVRILTKFQQDVLNIARATNNDDE